MSLQAIEEESLAEAVARRIRGVMGEARMSGVVLARRMGMTQAALSRRTTGAVPFSLDQVSLVAGVLGVSEAYLLGFSETRNPRPIESDAGEALYARRDLNPQPAGLSPLRLIVTTEPTPVEESDAREVAGHLTLVAGVPQAPAVPRIPKIQGTAARHLELVVQAS